MTRIPVGRVIEKLDAYLNIEGDFKSAERHLKYWLAEAEYEGDREGAFAIVNELIGLYRKCGRKEEAFEACDKALALTRELGIEERSGGGTAYLNAATARKAFGEPQEALQLYERARAIYERELMPEDPRLAGLYNNMALALTDLGRYEEAEQLFLAAIGIMRQQDQGEADCAVSWQNLAEMEERRSGFADAQEQILSYMDRAWEMLDAPGLQRNGYYAFVAEKCIPLFEHFEYYLIANELRKRIREIREPES